VSEKGNTQLRSAHKAITGITNRSPVGEGEKVNSKKGSMVVIESTRPTVRWGGGDRRPNLEEPDPQDGKGWEVHHTYKE